METVGMSNQALIQIILGFVGPLVIALATRPGMTPIAKIGIQAAYSVLAGTLIAWAYGGFEGNTWINAVLTVLATSILAYQGLWKPTGIADKVEGATSPAPRRMLEDGDIALDDGSK